MAGLKRKKIADKFGRCWASSIWATPRILLGRDIGGIPATGLVPLTPKFTRNFVHYQGRGKLGAWGCNTPTYVPVGETSS